VNNVLSDIATSSNWIDKSKEGIYVQASSLGSLKAITEFLKSPAVNIPVCDCFLYSRSEPLFASLPKASSALGKLLQSRIAISKLMWQERERRLR
jgi:hypothetical protein